MFAFPICARSREGPHVYAGPTFTGPSPLEPFSEVRRQGAHQGRRNTLFTANPEERPGVRMALEDA